MAMMKSRTYVILGNPIPLQRARSNARGRPWDPQRAEKAHWISQLEIQHEDMPMFMGAVRVDFTFRFNVPQAHQKVASNLIDVHHIYRPDLSNLVKFAEDCCQGILYRDDCIIAELNAVKIYGEKGCTEFTITPLKGT